MTQGLPVEQLKHRTMFCSTQSIANYAKQHASTPVLSLLPADWNTCNSNMWIQARMGKRSTPAYTR